MDVHAHVTMPFVNMRDQAGTVVRATQATPTLGTTAAIRMLALTTLALLASHAVIMQHHEMTMSVVTVRLGMRVTARSAASARASPLQTQE